MWGGSIRLKTPVLFAIGFLFLFTCHWRFNRCVMVARLKLKEIDGRAPPGVEPAA